MADNVESDDQNEELFQRTATMELSVPPGEDLDLVKDVLRKIPREVAHKFGDKQDYFTRRNLDNDVRIDPDIARNNKDSLSTKPNIFVIGEYNSLVVERSHFNWDGSDEYVVKNPKTEKIVLKLPHPTPQEKAEHLNSVFDHDPASGEAKLLHECRTHGHNQNRAKNHLLILTIGRDLSWRKLEICAQGEEKSKTSGRQNIHFFEFFNEGQENNLRVRTFDLRRESLEVNTLCLNTIFQDLVRPCLFFWENRLAVGNMTSEHLQVIELEKQDRDHDEEYYKWGHDQKITAEVLLTFLKKYYYFSRRERIFPLKCVSSELWFEIRKEDDNEKLCNYIVERFCYDVEAMGIKQTVREEDEEEVFLFERHEKNSERRKLLGEQERKR